MPLRIRTITFTASATDAIAAENEYYPQHQGLAAAARWETAVSGAVSSLLSMTERGALVRTRRRSLADLRWIFVPGFPFRLFYAFQASVGELCVVHLIHNRRKIDDLLKVAAAEVPRQ